MAEKKKSPDTGFAKLKDELSSGELANIYLFHGEERYLR